MNLMEQILLEGLLLNDMPPENILGEVPRPPTVVRCHWNLSCFSYSLLSSRGGNWGGQKKKKKPAVPGRTVRRLFAFPEVAIAPMCHFGNIKSETVYEFARFGKKEIINISVADGAVCISPGTGIITEERQSKMPNRL